MSAPTTPPRVVLIAIRDVLYPELDRVQHILHKHTSCIAPGYHSSERLRAWAAALRQDVPAPTIDDAIKQLRLAHREGHDVRPLDRVNAFPQARAFLRVLHESGCKIVSVSDQAADDQTALLDRLSLLTHIDACVGGGVSAPEAVSGVADEYQEQPGAIVVIGAGADTPLFGAARSRGWRCFELNHRASVAKSHGAGAISFTSWKDLAAACGVSIPEVTAAAIASFGNPGDLERCVSQFTNPLAESRLVYVSVVDDRPAPRTREIIARHHADWGYWEADGELWWSGATNAAVVDGAIHGATTILLLNPDCHVDSATLDTLVRRSTEDKAMVAAAVVDRARPDVVHWAGSLWRHHPRLRWVRYEPYAVRPGSALEELGQDPFPTADTGGRGVVVPIHYFDEVGLFDARAFPQYGGDNDFGLRVLRRRLPCVVDPTATASIDATNSGQAALDPGASVLRGVWKRLTQQKHGDAVRTTAGLLRRHASRAEFLPSLAYGVTRGVVGYYLRLRRAP